VFSGNASASADVNSIPRMRRPVRSITSTIDEIPTLERLTSVWRDVLGPPGHSPGAAWLPMSTAAFHVPSDCRRQIVT
jgi:hypothetical protein